jgi:ABC-type multidrug transport system permease subunit
MEFLNIQYYSSNETAQNDLIQGKIQAVLIIPSNFGESCNSFWRAPVSPSLWVNTTVQLYLDSGSIFLTQAIPPIIQQVIATTIYGEQPALVTPIKIGSPSLIQANKLTTYDYFAPGIFAFSTIFSIMTVASSFALEHEKGLLRRINTTPTAPTEIIVSQAVSNMIVAMIQVAIVFIMSFIVGYRPQGNVLVVVPAFIFLSIFSLCCVGFGLISAIIGKSPGAANGLSFIFTLPLMFLGTYITIGLSPTVQSLGKVVPSYYVTDALTSLLLRGAPIFSPTVLVDFAAVSIYSIIVLVIGIVLFRKYSKD